LPYIQANAVLIQRDSRPEKQWHALAPIDIAWKPPTQEDHYNLETKRHDQGRVGDALVRRSG